MQRTRALPVPVMAALLTGLPAFVVPPAAAQEFPSLIVGQPVQGVLTRDEPSFRDTPFRAYSFDAEAGKVYVIELRSRDFDAFLTVGRIVTGLTEYMHQNDDASGTDARLFFRPEDPGEYVVVAATVDGKSGAYDLSVDEVVERVAEPRPVAIGATVEATLDDRSGFTMDEGGYHDLHALELPASQTVVIALDSDAFDTFLPIGTLDGGAFTELDSNDDADGTNSLLRFTSPSAGVYAVRVSALGTGGAGAYVLTVLDAAATRTAEPVGIRSGQTLQGELDLRDRHSDELGYYDEYHFDAFSVQRVLVDLESEAFDPHLYLGRMEGNAFVPLTDNDDGNGMNSRIRFTLPAPGRYVLRAATVAGGGRGPYTIAIREIAPAGPLVARPLAAGEDVSGTLDETDYVDGEERAFEEWRHAGTAGDAVVVSARSFEFDTYLSVGRLEDGRYVELESNDDADGGTDSRVQVVVPATGELVIRVSAFGGGEGRYVVRVDTGTAGRTPR